MKEFFAAPFSGLPSEPTALGSHASRLHFAMKLFFAAPASGFPSFPIAWLSHVPDVPWAAAEPIAIAVINAARNNRFIVLSLARLPGGLRPADSERKRVGSCHGGN